MPPQYDDNGDPVSQGFGRDRRDNTYLLEKLDSVKDNINRSIQLIRSELYQEINKSISNQGVINQELIKLTAKVNVLTWVGQIMATAAILAFLAAVFRLIFVK